AEETQQNTAAGELLYALAILKGVEDLNLTVDYLDRAVAHKNVPAMTLLGHIYRGGKFDPENGFAKAFGWFYTAQQKGDKSAQQPLDQQIDELSADPALLQKTVDWFSQPVELLENPYFPVQEIQDRLALIQLANGESFSD